MVRVAGVGTIFLGVLTLGPLSSDAEARPGAPVSRPKPNSAGGSGGTRGGGKPSHGGRHKPRLKPAPALAVLPTLSRVELAIDGSFVIVTETLQLARNDYEKGELRVCIGHGAPGAPKAFEARLLASERQPDLPSPPAQPAVLSTEFAPTCPVNARIVLGGHHMATSVVTIGEPLARATFERSDLAVLQIRFLIESPQPGRDGGREILLRLGAPEETPITLSSIAVVSRAEKIAVKKAEAVLCGPDADSIPLTVEGAIRTSPTLNPALTIRRPSDELCVRYWADTR